MAQAVDETQRRTAAVDPRAVRDRRVHRAAFGSFGELVSSPRSRATTLLSKQRHKEITALRDRLARKQASVVPRTGPSVAGLSSPLVESTKLSLESFPFLLERLALVIRLNAEHHLFLFTGSRPLSTAAPPPNLTSESAPLTPRPPIPSEVKRSRRPEAAAEEDDDSAPAARALSTHSLSLLYAFSTPPPLSALSAFASRLALSASSSSASASLASHLPLLEQCLIHPSFWEGVRDLPPRSPSSPARQHTHFHDSIARDSHNAALATLGNALLGTLASELLLSSFPVLPTQVLKAACTMYVGPKSLAAVGGSWGIGPSRLDRRLVGGGVDGVEGRESKKDRAYAHLVGGVGGAKKGVEGKDGAAGMGLVRWNRRVSISGLRGHRQQ